MRQLRRSPSGRRRGHRGSCAGGADTAAGGPAAHGCREPSGGSVAVASARPGRIRARRAVPAAVGRADLAAGRRGLGGAGVHLRRRAWPGRRLPARRHRAFDGSQHGHRAVLSAAVAGVAHRHVARARRGHADTAARRALSARLRARRERWRSVGAFARLRGGDARTRCQAEPYHGTHDPAEHRGTGAGATESRGRIRDRAGVGPIIPWPGCGAAGAILGPDDRRGTLHHGAGAAASVVAVRCTVRDDLCDERAVRRAA